MDCGYCCPSIVDCWGVVVVLVVVVVDLVVVVVIVEERGAAATKEPMTYALVGI